MHEYFWQLSCFCRRYSWWFLFQLTEARYVTDYKTSCLAACIHQCLGPSTHESNCQRRKLYLLRFSSRPTNVCILSCATLSSQDSRAVKIWNWFFTDAPSSTRCWLVHACILWRLIEQSSGKHSGPAQMRNLQQNLVNFRTRKQSRNMVSVRKLMLWKIKDTL